MTVERERRSVEFEIREAVRRGGWIYVYDVYTVSNILYKIN